MTTKAILKNQSLKNYTNDSAQALAKSSYSIWYWIIPPLIIALLTFIVYLPSLNYPFQFDDLPNILKFYEIRHLQFKDIFLTSTRWITRWINTFYYSIGKFDPFIYRLGNVFIHTINSILIFFIIFSLSKRNKHNNFLKNNAFSIALTAGILFALHPVQTQTISYVIHGQGEGLATLFIMAVISLFIIFCSLKDILIKFICFIALFGFALLSCGTKEIVIVTPALLLLVDWFFIAQGSFQEFKKRIFLHIFIGIFFLANFIIFLKLDFFQKLFSFNLAAQNNFGNTLTIDQNQKILPFNYFISQFKVILHYAWIFICPYFSADYDWKLAESFWSYDCLIPFIILALSIILIVFRLRKNHIDIFSFIFLWFFVTIIPRSSIIPSSELLADYKTYLASFSIIFFISIFINLGIKKINNFLINYNHNTYPNHYYILIFALILGYATSSANKVWSSDKNFWQNVMEKAPNRARGYNNYGFALSNQKQYKESILYFKKAIELDKNYPDPWLNLAAAYNYLGEIDKAIVCAQTSISINPHLPEAYTNLGTLLLTKKEYEGAKAAFEKALTYRPYYGKVLYNLGTLYVNLNDMEKAYAYFKKACTQGDFDNDMGFSTYGRICIELKKYDEALFALYKSYDLKQSAEVLNQIAYTYYLSKNYLKAQEIYYKLTTISGYESSSWFQLGECYTKNDDYNKALSCYSKALNINPNAQIAFRIAGCLERLGKYDQAIDMLKSILHQNPPENIKNEILNSLRQLQKLYGKKLS